MTTAIGFEIYHRPPIDFAPVRPTTISPEKAAYLRLRCEADSKWHEFCRKVDEWVANGDYDTMEAFADECNLLDHKAHLAYLTMERSYSRASFKGAVSS